MIDPVNDLYSLQSKRVKSCQMFPPNRFSLTIIMINRQVDQVTWEYKQNKATITFNEVKKCT